MNWGDVFALRAVDNLPSAPISISIPGEIEPGAVKRPPIGKRQQHVISLLRVRGAMTAKEVATATKTSLSAATAQLTRMRLSMQVVRTGDWGEYRFQLPAEE